MVSNILKNILINKNATYDDVVSLLMSDDKSIFESANFLCQKYKSNFIHLRALIEFTNICKNDCLYCGLRCSNKNVQRYRMSESEILEMVKKSVNLGYRTIVLQGGEDSFFDTDKLCAIAKKIKKHDVALTYSVGEKTYEEYKALKESGVDRYLLRIETTDEELYKKMHPNMSYKNRFDCLESLKKLGFETGTGSLVGLPNQTVESLANDILFFKELNADMVGVGPFIPHPQTPLFNENSDNFDMALKVMAVTRLLLPDINIPATTAMETIRTNGRVLALNSGANVIMVNITSDEHKSNYEIYPNKIGSDISAEKATEEIKTLILNSNRKISKNKGFRFE